MDYLTCRIINLFTGQARTLPKNHLKRLYISELTSLKYFCKNRYLTNVIHKLYKQNKLTSPDQSKTWLHLLRKPSQTYVDIPYTTSFIEDINEENIDDELRHVNIEDKGMADIQEDTANPVEPNIDFTKKNDDLFLENEPSQEGRKFTRSGKSYTVTIFPKKTKQPSFETCLKSMTLHQAIACRKAEKFSNCFKGVADKRFSNIDLDNLKMQKIRFTPKKKISEKK